MENKWEEKIKCAADAYARSNYPHLEHIINSLSTLRVIVCIAYENGADFAKSQLQQENAELKQSLDELNGVIDAWKIEIKALSVENQRLRGEGWIQG